MIKQAQKAAVAQGQDLDHQSHGGDHVTVDTQDRPENTHDHLVNTQDHHIENQTGPHGTIEMLTEKAHVDLGKKHLRSHQKKWLSKKLRILMLTIK